MADNIAVTPGSGVSMATDDIGGVQYPRAKLSLGADGTAVDAVGGAGAVSSAVQRVTLASDDPAVAALLKLVATTPANISGTIATGGTAQQAASSNAARRGFFIQNHSADDLWVNTLATAVVGQPSIKIQPGAMYETPAGSAGTGAISIIGPTAGQAWTGREW